jgi:flavin-dependent trigonelline monooxygenase, reductase component
VALDPATYRTLAGAFPTGVTVITTTDADGRPRALTTQSFVGLSTSPPLVLISVGKLARTLDVLRQSGRFVVNFLGCGGESLSQLFASKAEDKFRNVKWRASAAAGGAPILDEHIIGYAECVTINAIEAGDHFIFIGEVVGGEDLGGRPLLYFRRQYAGWPTTRELPESQPIALQLPA